MVRVPRNVKMTERAAPRGDSFKYEVLALARSCGVWPRGSVWSAIASEVHSAEFLPHTCRLRRAVDSVDVARAACGDRRLLWGI